MSLAYFIVVNSEAPGFDTFVDGKVLTRHIETINAAASELGQKSFDDYLSQDLSEFGMDESEPVWFDAAEGVEWISTLRAHFAAQPGLLPDADDVLADFDEFLRVLEEARQRKLQWHLEADF